MSANNFLSGLAQQPGLDGALQYTIDHLMQAVGATSGSVFITEPGSDELRLAKIQGGSRENLVGLSCSIGEGITGWVAQQRQPMLVTSIDNDEQLNPLRNADGDYASSSFISAPILHDNELIGVVNLTDKRAQEPFDSRDLSVLMDLARQAAPTLAKRLKQDHTTTAKGSLAEKVELARAELELATSRIGELKSLNESILNCIPQPVIAFDRSLHATFCNHASRELFGEDVASISLMKLPLVPREGTWSTALLSAVEDGHSVRFDEAAFAPPGRVERIVKVVVSPARENGTTVGGMLVVEDVDDKVRLQRQLSQAERLAAIGKLSATVAHELNNPIDGVLRYINLTLKVEPDNERLKRYLTESRSGLQRMARIVKSLLEYSRSTRQVGQHQSVSAMVRSSLRLLEARQAEASVDVKVDLAEELDTPARECLTQCFLNVIRNAYDAMPQGGLLTISGSLEGTDAVINFTDTGPGIPSEAIGRVFDPFFTTKADADGTGLGLAVSRDLTAECGGDMEVFSPEGQGATFRFRFPVR